MFTIRELTSGRLNEVEVTWFPLSVERYQTGTASRRGLVGDDDERRGAPLPHCAKAGLRAERRDASGFHRQNPVRRHDDTTDLLASVEGNLTDGSGMETAPGYSRLLDRPAASAIPALHATPTTTVGSRRPDGHVLQAGGRRFDPGTLHLQITWESAPEGELNVVGDRMFQRGVTVDRRNHSDSFG